LKAVSKKALDRARAVRLMIFDVDGVLTDGTLLYGPQGEALKAFSAHDGHGLKMLAASGVACALLSGRRSAAVAKRAAELGIENVFQGVEDKLAVFRQFIEQQRLTASQAGFMGDELVDLPVLTRCGFACAPREAPEAVRRRVHYVAAAVAGRGAVREVCELVMRAQRTFEPALERYLA
jgi:3-deoxy-D-manno-octulosonate 8-phosphate phosphatase (KDO 8-P phosphatase)